MSSREKSNESDSSMNWFNRMGAKYFDAINRNKASSLEKRIERLSVIADLKPDVVKIASIGVGGGIELMALNEIFKSNKPRFIGVDISPTAIKESKKYLSQYKDEIVIDYLEKDAADSGGLGLDNLDLVAMCSITHELFSYNEDGVKQTIQSIKNGVKALSNNGLLFIQDFSRPNYLGTVKVTIKNQEALDFFKYFIENFKNRIDYSVPEFQSDGRVLIDACLLSELMLHYQNHRDHVKKEIIEFADPDWSELHENYVFLNGILDDSQSDKDLFYEVESATSSENIHTELVHYGSYPRSKTADFLKTCFEIQDSSDHNITESFLSRATSKVEIGIKRIK